MLRDELGTIEAGKWADLVVFDGDIMGAPIEEIDLIPHRINTGGWESGLRSRSVMV